MHLTRGGGGGKGADVCCHVTSLGGGLSLSAEDMCNTCTLRVARPNSHVYAGGPQGFHRHNVKEFFHLLALQGAFQCYTVFWIRDISDPDPRICTTD